MPYKIIDESVFGPHFTKFKSRYFIVGNWSGYDEVIGYQNEEELKNLIASNSIRIDIRDVIKDLPEEKNIIKIVKLNDKSSRIYKDLMKHMIVDYDKGQVVANNVLERLIRLSQITSGYLVDKELDTVEDVGSEKINTLKEVISGVEEKVMIVCRFTRSIDRVAKLCEDMGKSYYIYDGRTKDKELYLKFNKDDTKVWICQIKKSTGYSMQSVQYCIFFELEYSRETHVQSRGRILRANGSPHTDIFYVYLLASNTVDEAIYSNLIEKDQKSKTALEIVKSIVSVEKGKD